MSFCEKHPTWLATMGCPMCVKEYKERINKLEDLISEAAPLTWAHSNSVATIEDAYAWEKKAKFLLENK